MIPVEHPRGKRLFFPNPGCPGRATDGERREARERCKKLLTAAETIRTTGFLDGGLLAAITTGPRDRVSSIIVLTFAYVVSATVKINNTVGRRVQ
jgi:hypothetical protein